MVLYTRTGVNANLKLSAYFEMIAELSTTPNVANFRNCPKTPLTFSTCLLQGRVAAGEGRGGQITAATIKKIAYSLN